MELRRAVVCVVLAAALASGCGGRIAPPSAPGAAGRAIETREGLASYYGRAFQGKPTASGQRFDMRALVAAHPSYPFGTLLRVTNLANGRQVRVRVIDRGPADGPRSEGVIVDLSRRSAEVLGFIREGRTRVRLEVLQWGRR